MRVLLIGSGGREHALAWALSASPLLTSSTLRRETPGSAESAECVSLDPADHGRWSPSAGRRRSTWSSSGRKRRWSRAGRRARRGGNRALSGRRKRRRSSRARKVSRRIFAARPAFRPRPIARFTNRDGGARLCAAHTARRSSSRRMALRPARASPSPRTATRRLPRSTRCLDGAFGEAGADVVIEEFLEGEEASFFALCDGDDGAAPRHGAGPQARLRRRHRPEHRRHGRLLAGAGA